MDVNRYRISAVMPVRDRFEMALRAVETLINQTERPLEIVIVDDGSMIPFEQHIGALMGTASTLGIPLKVCRHELSKGVSAARNHGFAISQGDFVCFCDSDDYWTPRKLEVIGKIITTSPAVDVLFHSFFWRAGSLRIFALLPADRLVRLSKWLLVSFAFLNPSCLCIKRTAYQTGFREDMKHHEDLEYFLRLSKFNDIWFYNNALTEMGRVPGSEGGASHDTDAMRRGATTALAQYVGPTPVGLLAFLKICYHKTILFLGTVRASSKYK